MAKISDMLVFLRKREGLSQQELADKTGLTRSAIGMYETGKREPDIETMEVFADFYNVDMNTLTGRPFTPPATINVHLQAPDVTEDTVSFPIIGDVAAGYDYMAMPELENECVSIPREFLRGRDPTEYFVLKVRGNSMYPLYMEGDIVLVLRQETLNRSGEIGVVIYDDENATLKKVEYVEGEDWLEMIPINPQYQPVRIEDERLEHCHVLGIPKLIIRNV